MKNIILGTAGHVDHGKTALIKALTNIDTDRLKEEKERGITIELGFASFTLENGQTIGIIDVPGHERFVKNMVAGAGGIDVVAMVIAADEGIMPQTREHLEICELLNIKHGLVALTKIDLVDREWLSMVEEEIHDFLKGTFLDNAPIVPLSAFSGEGISDFVSALTKIIAETETRPESDFFRLPVDRIFTMKGFGTVVTGTLVSGHVSTGETIEIMPSRQKAKVRGIQIHSDAAASAHAGQRTAINIQGVDKTLIDRGFILTHPDIFEPSKRIDIFLKYLPGNKKKLKNRSFVRLHSGTSEILSKITIPGREEIEPGENVYAQLLLKSPAILISGDRFVVRSYSPINTIGGGEIIDPNAKKFRKSTAETIKELEELHVGTQKRKTEIILHRAHLEGISVHHLSIRTGIPLAEQNKILDEMFSKKEALLADKEDRTIISFPLYQEFQTKIINTLTGYHEKFPLKRGIIKEELRVTLGDFIDSKLFNKALRELDRKDRIVIDHDLVHLADYRVNLAGEIEVLQKEIIAIYCNSALTPPLTKEVFEKYPRKRNDIINILNILLREGILIKINEEMYFYRSSLDALQQKYIDLLLRDKKASPASFRDLTGLSRKYTIPLMEYFDKIKLTMRVGDHRVLRKG